MKSDCFIFRIVFYSGLSCILSSCCVLAFDCLDVSTGELNVHIIDSNGKDLLDSNILGHLRLNSISNNVKDARWVLSIKDTAYPSQLSGIRIQDLLFPIEENKLQTDTLYLNFENNITDTLIYDKISKSPQCCTETKFNRLEYNGESFALDDVFPEITFMRK